ncbi:MAG: type II toxin-antitoxin system RelE/ParE family toxin [Desulfomonilaceae bacterium]
MRVRWTNTAANHLRAIHDYAAQNSKIYADRLIDRLIRKSEQIGRFPQSGRMVPEYRREDIREVIERPYRIIYRVKGQQIDVLAVLHGARQFPPEVPE